ncbi:MAG TPA: hypothetical protein VGW57_04830 [Chthoniobacterales bacterium]|nr:hypothetical protein [Chthoniobacterales bacterium]
MEGRHLFIKWIFPEMREPIPNFVRLHLALPFPALGPGASQLDVLIE